MSSKITSQTTLPMSHGKPMPVLGFGTYDPDPQKAYDATLHALRTGWRHLDSAMGYNNEEGVGRAVHDFLVESDGKVKREDIFVTTKLPGHLHKPGDVEWALETSLKSLGMEYVDLYLIHWPYALERTEDHKQKQGEDGKAILIKDLTVNPEPTWRAMEGLQSSGKAKAIGVSNFSISMLETMKSYARTMPANNQCECHPLLPNANLVRYCIDNDIVFSAYSPLGGQNERKPLFQNEGLMKLAEKKGCTVAQVLIAWGLDRGCAVLPKSFTPKRIESNFELVQLSEEDVQEVEKATGGHRERFCDWKMPGFEIWPNGEE